MGSKPSIEEGPKGLKGYDCFYDFSICDKNGDDPLYCVTWMDQSFGV